MADDLRPLDDAESAALRAILAVDVTGIDALRAQAATVLARPGCDCGCGCGTLELVVPGAGASGRGLTVRLALVLGDAVPVGEPGGAARG